MAFYADESGVMTIERGPNDQPSALAQKGIQGATPAELWQLLLPDQPLPPELTEAEPIDVDPEEIQPEPVPSGIVTDGVGAIGGGGEAQVEAQGDGIASTRQAFSANGDHFLAAGGCDTRPVAGGTEYAGVVARYCRTGYTGDGMWTAYTAAGVRWRVASVRGGFYANYSQAGIWKSYYVNPGWWANMAYQNKTQHLSWSCGFLGLASCTEIRLRKDYMRLEITEAAGDTMHVGAIYLDSDDQRYDSQPWVWYN